MIINNVKHLISAMLILAFTLTACSLPLGNIPVDVNQVETMAASTISALFTQIANQTQSARLTQQVIATRTTYPMETLSPTLSPTFTPYFTATSVPPTRTPIRPTATPIPIPCNAADFKGDITIDDGTLFYAGDEFTKIWRIKNVGSCSWTKDYKIFFFSGDQMAAPSAVAFPEVVDPGESVDLEIDMVAPNAIGSFKGNWKFKSANGTVFGVGGSNNVAVWVSIKVNDFPGLKDPNAVYDFTKNYCDATWRTNTGSLDCPSLNMDFVDGSITRTYTPVLEGGYKDDEGALITIPANGDGGWIRGKYPSRWIKSGDHFAALLACGDKQTNCSVTFELLYSVVGNSNIYSLGTWNHSYGDPKVKPYVDLSGLAGEQVNLFLKVTNNGTSVDDMAMWVAARITRP